MLQVKQSARPVCYALAALLALLVLGSCGQPLPRDTTFEVVATEMAFTPSTLELAQGEMVTLRLVNEGKLAHNLLIDLPSGTREIAAPDGVDALLTFPTRDVGSFRFYCNIAGHEGMEGVLTIR